MGKFSLTNLIMCVSKYQKLNSEDYIRMGLCLPDCQDCRATGQGHYTHLKSDHTVSLNTHVILCDLSESRGCDWQSSASSSLHQFSVSGQTGIIWCNLHTSTSHQTHQHWIF